MTSKVNAVDLSAKLLATENLSVRRARTKTASFDIKSRVLTLPMWKEMTPEIEGMLVGHEVGHALYTTDEYIAPIKETPKLQGYLNVLEDVRIEKLMKRKYPGIRKTMNEGYKQLNERDFFGVAKTQDLSTLILIDRINLYFKAGYSCGVKFTPDEMVFVRRAESTESIDEVVQLAKEVYDFSKAEVSKRLEEMKDELPKVEGDEFEDPDGLDEIDDDFGGYDDSDMDETGEETDEDGLRSTRRETQSLGKTDEEMQEQRLDEALESLTDRNFYQKLEEMADDDTDIFYHSIDDKYVVDHIIGYKRIIKETSDLSELFAEYQDTFKSMYDKFKPDADRVVNYLVKEFEMKKSAQLYKRAQTAKVGSLDMKKVWSYKLNDDLFKRVTTIPQGKNHGMIFLLDWSGSMDGVIEDTVKQVITLAMFCQRTQIPYQVFAFSSQYDLETENYLAFREKRQAFWDPERTTNLLSNAQYSFALLELFSSKMSSVEFNTMVKRLLPTRYFCRSTNGAYSTGGTPLNEALAYMVDYIPKFVKSHNVEKMSLITLTDGEGGSLQSNAAHRSGLDDYRIDTSEGYKKIKQKHYLKDDVTKKSYEITRYSNTHTEAILRLLKDRYNINSVGFFICANNRRDLSSAINSNVAGFNGNMYVMIDVMRKDFRDLGFFSVKNTGRDDLFIIPQNRLAIEQQEMEVNAKQTAKQIANRFTKMMSNKKTSRVLLNKFIGYVA